MNEIITAGYQEAWELEHFIPRLSVIFDCVQVYMCAHVYSMGMDFQSSDSECERLMCELSPCNLEYNLNCMKYAWVSDADGMIHNEAQQYFV